MMGCLPEPDPVTGLLPPGRHTADLGQLRAAFVDAPCFSDADERKLLWDEWECHRGALEAVAGEISRLWVAGSFVSAKEDPGDIDVTYLLRAEVHDRLDREALGMLDDLTDRGWCADHGMRVDASVLRLPEDMPVWRMARDTLPSPANDSFRDIGLYDEIWQRTRSPKGVEGEVWSLRRGYVEVLL
ncbi:hypothetical protein H340_30943 [Streptomyces mobaraensis NBRC 13819 = DSM 40847]|uniref:Uncharacterized protein n=1 Tax=Streptomyces mobaraensis (strain ATCC 29032 / DSM 40847 / JCM 4168 / NBRC 13819 / NCIMB 11159 / IPCR 16-22) TaxID=1223523 RepID=M3BY17_STRM1|nr:hypothetical protein H340_30943 [Streptomyces mobaraensis NBRC 13819 = DSM 40847]